MKWDMFPECYQFLKMCNTDLKWYESEKDDITEFLKIIYLSNFDTVF